MAQIIEVFFQAEAVQLHDGGVGQAYVPEMPVRRNAGDIFFSFRIPLDKAIGNYFFPEEVADPVFGEAGADEIDGLPVQSQVNGKAGLVFAAVRQGHVFTGKFLTVFRQRGGVDLFLFCEGAVAADRNQGGAAADSGKQNFPEQGRYGVPEGRRSRRRVSAFPEPHSREEDDGRLPAADFPGSDRSGSEGVFSWFHRQPDQGVYDFFKGHSDALQHAGIAAVCGKAGDGIHFVEDDSVVRCQEHVHPGKTSA